VSAKGVVGLVDRILKPVSLHAQLRERNRKKAVKLRSAQAMLIRYPKSGVTWLRLMVSHVYLGRIPTTRIELIGSTPFERMLPAAPRLFVAGPVNSTTVDTELFASLGAKKAILLLRDPRDVAVSLYFHMARRATPLEHLLYSVPKHLEQEGLYSFVMNPVCGIPRIALFMNEWWTRVSNSANSLVLRYEDMRASPAATLDTMLRFLGDDPSSDEIEASVAFATLEAMKEREREGQFRTAALRPGNKEDEDSYKTRKGEVGGFASYFDPREIEEMSSLMRASLHPHLGYPRVT
jgi:Sulfotransferase domain